jgi:hypothetical protein
MEKRNFILIILLTLFLMFTSFTMSYAQPSQLAIVRASDNSLWKATCTGLTCTGFTSFPGMFGSQPAVTWDENIQRYVVWGRASDGSIWRSTFNSVGTFMNDWVSIPGSTPSPVAVAGSDLVRAGVSSIDKGAPIDIATLSTDCNNRTTLRSLTLTLPTRAMNVITMANGIFVPTIADRWVSICINDSATPATTCDSWTPVLESNPIFSNTGEKHFALQEVQYGETGTQSYYVTACRQAGATGTIFVNDFIAIAVPQGY